MLYFGAKHYYTVVIMISAFTLGVGYLMHRSWLGLLLYLLLNTSFLLYSVFTDQARPLSKPQTIAASLCPLFFGSIGISMLVNQGIYGFPFSFVSSGLMLFTLMGFLVLIYVRFDQIWPRFMRDETRKTKGEA